MSMINLIIKKPANLFQRGDFTLNSGLRRDWKIECDALTNDDLEALVCMALPILPRFSTLVSVPGGGDRIVDVLQQYAAPEGWTLIVDDVLTTGGSMERAREKQKKFAWPPIAGFVLFACGPVPEWIIPLFSMSKAVDI